MMSTKQLFKTLLISSALTVTSLGLSACNNGGDSGPSGDVINLDVSEVDLTEPVGDNQQQASGLKVEPSRVDSDSSQTVKVTNTSSQAISNLNVKLAGSNLKGVTVSGCQGRLAGGSSCKLKVKANSQASGSGKIIVSASGVDDKDIPVAVKSAYLESSGNTLTKPSSGLADVRWITIKNNSEVTAQFKEANVTLSDSQGDNITIKKDLNSVSQKQPHSNCFDQSKPYNDKGTITLAPQSKDNSQCEIPIVAEAEAKSHVFINISGNFFHDQHIPVNISPVLWQYQGSEGGDINKAVIESDQTEADQPLFNRRKDHSNNISDFTLGKDEVTMTSVPANEDRGVYVKFEKRDIEDDIKQFERTFNDIPSGESGIGSFQLYNPQQDNISVLNYGTLVTLTGDNLADNFDPLPVISVNAETTAADDSLILYAVPRQQMNPKKRKRGFVKLIVTRAVDGASDVSDIKYKKSDNIEIVDSESDTTNTCKNNLNNGNQDQFKPCTIWIKANQAKIGQIGSKTADFQVSYDKEDEPNQRLSTNKLNMTIHHNLVAAGAFQAQSVDVDNPSIMSWDGDKWHWDEAGETVFSEIDHAVVDDKGRVCVNGVTGFDTKGSKQYDFDCFNGYRWAGVANPQDSDGMAVKRFAILRAGDVISPANLGEFEISNGLVAVPADSREDIYISKDGSWSNKVSVDKQIGNLILSPAFKNLDKAIGFATQYDTVNKASIFSVSLDHSGIVPRIKVFRIANTIHGLHRPKIGDEEKPYRLAAYVKNGNNSNNLGRTASKQPVVIIGGESNNNQPIVYKNEKQAGEGWQDDWTKLGGPDVKGQMTVLKASAANDIIMAVVTNKGTEGQVYHYDGSKWRQIKPDHQLDPVMSLYDNTVNNNGKLYIGTSQLDLDSNTLKRTSLRDGVVLNEKSGAPIWGTLLNSSSSQVNKLLTVNRISIDKYEKR